MKNPTYTAKTRLIRLLRIISVIMLLAGVLAACGGSSGTQEEQLLTRYQAAVKDAEHVDQSKVVDDLVAIVDSNHELIWRRNGGDEEVLLVTWTDWNGYKESEGESIDLQREVWTTVAPQVQTFCQNDIAANVDYVLRVEELLGLPPRNDKQWFVELWAKPTDIFRPSPDPEIDDSKAELDFPPDVDPAHVAWFNNLLATSYGPNGYPWTRLGYTYDWGKRSGIEGLSEFVIRKGAKVTVHAAIANSDYCARPEAEPLQSGALN